MYRVPVTLEWHAARRGNETMILGIFWIFLECQIIAKLIHSKAPDRVWSPGIAAPFWRAAIPLQSHRIIGRDRHALVAGMHRSLIVSGYVGKISSIRSETELIVGRAQAWLAACILHTPKEKFTVRQLTKSLHHR